MRRLLAPAALAVLLAAAPAAPALAAQDPYMLRFSPQATIVSSTATVTTIAVEVAHRCPVGSSEVLDVVVSQGSTGGFGTTSVSCTGKEQKATVDVSSNFGGPAFTSGQAEATATFYGTVTFEHSDYITIR